LNQYDKNNALNYFFKEFRNECPIISDIFFGFTEATNECINCKNIYNSKGLNSPICYNYAIFNCLIFPLEEVKKMINNSVQNKEIQNKLILFQYMIAFVIIKKVNYLLGKIEIIVIFVSNYLILFIHLKYLYLLMY